MKVGRWTATTLAVVSFVAGGLFLIIPPLVIGLGLDQSKFPPEMAPTHLLSLGALLIFSSILFFAVSKLFVLLHEFAQHLSNRDLQSKEGIALLRRLPRSCIRVFWLELGVTLAYHLLPYQSSAEANSSSADALVDAVHFLPALSGGGCLVAALIFAALREALETNRGLQKELDLTI